MKFKQFLSINGPAMIAILDKRTEERVATVGGPIAPGFEPILRMEKTLKSLWTSILGRMRRLEHLGD